MIGCKQPTLQFVYFLAVLIGTFPCYSQSVNPSKLKINALIGLDSTYAQVIELLGKPKKESKPQKEECTGGHEKTVEYDGLSFYFMDGPSKSKKTYLVMGFNLTSPKLTVSGVKVGDVEALVKKRYGKPQSVEVNKSAGETTWTYDIPEQQGGPGQASVTFKNGKVTAVGSSYMVC